MPSPETSAPQRRELQLLHRYMGEGERATLYQQLRAPRPLLVAVQMLLAWGLILSSWAACVYGSPLLLPLALALTASRQRAIGNMMHDAAHSNLLEGRAANRWFGTWILGIPLFEDFETYRNEHLRHHKYLGRPQLDPDYLELPANLSRPGQVYRHFLFLPSQWKAAAFGGLPRLTTRQRLSVLAFWACLAACLALVTDPLAAASFLGFWLLTRATAYHALKVFTELSDHIGLRPGSILQYTRNMPRNPLSFFLHPHLDNYHLTHHLFPNVPMANLARVHTILLPLESYASGHHFHRYFTGEASVVQSWVSANSQAVPPELARSA